MPPAPIRPHIPQPRDIQPELAAELVLDLQGRQLGVDVDDGLRGDGAEAGGAVDVQAGEEVGGGLGAEAVECLEGFLEGGRGG